jgi:transcription initiation factor IIE alpha subunit
MTERIREVNAAKYDILRTMLDVVLDVTEEIDETLGAEMGLEKSSLSFKKLNTLYEYGIIKENNKKTYKLI